MLVAIAVAGGIVIDRWLGGTWSAWLFLAAASIIGWLIAFSLRQNRLAATLLLLVCAAIAGARHHQFWSVVRANDISRYASTERQLVRLTGTISEQPWVRRAKAADWQTAIPQIDRSLCIVDAKSIESNGGDLPVSGRVRLTVSGHLLHVNVGDKICVVGWLSAPWPPGNPGQFDFGNHLRKQRCRSLLFANHPDAVTKLEEGDRNHPRRLLASFRDEAEQLCVSHLSEENLPIATALLLGDRSRMTDDIRDAFAKSGTAHVLAISGLHVGILAALLWLCCRLFNASPRTTAVVIVSGVMLYAVISGGRPPVSRATVFVLIAVGGFLLNRPAVAMNTLALAAIAVLAWNPSDLFDVGTQLSFLAVTGIIAARQWRPAEQNADDLIVDESAGFRRSLRTFGSWLLRGYAMMCGIWLLTVPLTASQFHLISPIGFLVNVVLIPFVCVLMWSGFAFLILGLLVPYVAAPLGILFDAQLSGLSWIVERAAEFRLGHLYGPGPSSEWMAVYYVLIAGMTFAILKRWQTRRVMQVLLIWTVVGLAIGMIPPQRDRLRVTFLDMGHGASVLIEMPNGKTLLYDAGSLTDADRAARTVENAIWAKGIHRLDAVVISHADVDHFNGMHGLFETIPVGRLMMSPTFLDFDQRAVRELCDVIDRRQIPVRLLQEGDRLLLDDDVAVSVLHPAGDKRFDSDNANSLVLLIEYAGRRFLFTGDLEKDGLRRLLENERQPVDVLQSPHHGSRAANSPELAEWAAAEWVVVGARENRLLPYLLETYGGQTTIYLTGEDGAVTFDVQPDGAMRISTGRRRVAGAGVFTKPR